jgi:exopolyphosphatase/guanosine-5'-triphosphate,3'-diphosphate pyrophosphatase
MIGSEEPRAVPESPPDGPVPQAAPVRVCVIDLGTNSFHAEIVDARANGTFDVLDKIKEMVQLGEQGLTRHRLSEKAMARGIEALRRIRILADGWGVEEYLAFATSAVREAVNGGDFIEQIREDLGLRVRPISGEKEARLIYEGVRRAVDMPDPTLLVDVGGGSTEFIVATSRELFFATSLKLGAARMTEQFVTTDPVEKAEFKALRGYYRQVLRPILAVAREYGVREIVGSSGTIENIAQVFVNQEGAARRTIYQHVFDGEALRRVTKALMRSSRAERAAVPGLDEKRLDQVVAGAVLVDVLLKDLAIARLRVSPHALREGMVVHFIERNYRRLEQLAPHADVRRRSVYELGHRCQWEEQHARHVADLALRLFDACRPLHGLGSAERDLLEYAALLHDIGYHISRSSHHKHALYLLKHADLRGFQPEEVDVMAHVARYHRGALPKAKHAAFRALPKATRHTILKLAALLRLAEGLDRSHFQNVHHLAVDLGKKAVTLRIRTASDPQLEVWGARRHADLFERVYGLAVRVEAVG